VAIVTTFVTMLLFMRLAGKKDKGGFIRDTTTRLMGLIVLSMGV
jgi:hypothetical protein